MTTCPGIRTLMPVPVRHRYVESIIAKVRDAEWPIPTALYALAGGGFVPDEKALIDALEWHAAAELHDANTDPEERVTSPTEWNREKATEAWGQYAALVAVLAGEGEL